MINILTDIAMEEGTYAIPVLFTDEDDVSMTPNSVNWTLTDLSNRIINDRAAESETPASTVNIILSGADLRIFGVGATERRKVIISGTWDSATYGNDLPYKKVYQFEIYNIGFILYSILLDISDGISVTESVTIAIS